jgi:hypothetical protein
MDEAVEEIVGRAFETSPAPRLLESGFRANLIDRGLTHLLVPPHPL